ncbi:hypothetical protein LTR66_008115 [Elasticomyces elasticus]|nr:hypothetical protein LTR66_008115 [Elasticomyces elasticus]
MVDGAILDYVQSIPGPVTDITFGIDRASLDSDLKLAYLKLPLPHISEPMDGLYWPFLTMEFKSEGENASITAAVKQCAGAGTACLNSFPKLRALAPGEPYLHPPIRSNNSSSRRSSRASASPKRRRVEDGSVTSTGHSSGAAFSASAQPMVLALRCAADGRLPCGWQER